MTFIPVSRTEARLLPRFWAYCLWLLLSITMPLAVCGCGVLASTPAGGPSLSTTSLLFQSTTVGQVSIAMVVTVSNPGSLAFSLAAASTTGPFEITATTCGALLGARDSCTIALEFAPKSADLDNGTLHVRASTGEVDVLLQGTGQAVQQSPAQLAISLSSVTFPDTTVGMTSAPLSMTVTNSGDQASSYLTASATLGFSIANNTCSTILSGHSTCTMSIAFQPVVVGSQTGSLTIQQGQVAQQASLHGDALAHVLTISAPVPFVRVGDSAQLTAILDGTISSAVTWSVEGDPSATGSISAQGIYSPPLTVPASGQAVVTATSQQDTTVHTSFLFPVWISLASLSGSTPGTLPPGTTTVLLTGSNMSSVDKLLMNGSIVPFVLTSSSTLTATVSLPLWAAGTLSFVAETPGSEGGLSEPLLIQIKASAVSYDAAVRMTQQAGFGPTAPVVQDIQNLGFPAWIDKEMSTPAFDYTQSWANWDIKQWFVNTQTGDQNIRQKVGFALEQVFVNSTESLLCFEPESCGPLWENLLQKDALGNMRQLLQDVATSEMMGSYLDNIFNYTWPGGPVPNQNFGRELMQLMTIGTVQLQPDGQPTLTSSGGTIPTYTQANVVAMAAALTGWTPSPRVPNYIGAPMFMYDSGHDQGAKNILPGVTLPPGQGGVADLNAVLDALFQHPNMPPFWSKLLIQHLVKSNPSAAYVGRVSAVFSEDANGVRGNLAAVVKAILMDPEARAGDDPAVIDTTGGHLAEPLLYFTSLMNAVGGQYTDEQIQGVSLLLGQGLYQSPSVFSYYSPGHVLTDGTSAPEAQLLDNVYAFNKLSVTYELLHNTLGGTWVNWSSSQFWDSPSQSALLDQINHVLYHGLMSVAVRSTLETYISSQSAATLNSLLPDIIFLAVSNSGYQVYL